MAEVFLNKISKNYAKGAVRAVNDVSFEVAKGELFGLIGPDGAGKTSVFRILTTLVLPTAGTAFVMGCDVVKDYKIIRNNVGYMPGKFSLYEDLSVAENLNFFATVFNTTIAENYHLVKEIFNQLEPFKNRRAGKLSGGMKQKLALCCALIHRPKILFLDEPTTGVDVISRREFWGVLKALQKQGMTILVSTSYMDEASLCDRIALMQNGCLLSVDSCPNIINQYSEKLYAIKAHDMGKLLNDLRKTQIVKTSHAFGDCHHISFLIDDTQQKQELIRFLKKRLHRKIELNPIQPSIEDCFIKLMK